MTFLAQVSTEIVISCHMTAHGDHVTNMTPPPNLSVFFTYFNQSDLTEQNPDFILDFFGPKFLKMSKNFFTTDLDIVFFGGKYYTGN